MAHVNAESQTFLIKGIKCAVASELVIGLHVNKCSRPILRLVPTLEIISVSDRENALDLVVPQSLLLFSRKFESLIGFILVVEIGCLRQVG